MTLPYPPRPPHAMEKVVSAVLRTGVWSSVGLIAAGLLLWTAATPALWTDPTLLPALLARETTSPLGPVAVAARYAVLAGLLLLIVTPVFRVGLSMLAFWRSGERPFAWLSAAVLGLLAVSVAVGLLWR